MNFYAEAFVQQAQASLNQGVLTGLLSLRAVTWRPPQPES
jgi:hypothetical protein